MALAQADIHVKVDPNIKFQSEIILKEIGISMSDLVNMTLRRLIREKDIPFETSLKNIPECMNINSKEEMYAFIDKSILENEKSGKYYTIEEARASLSKA